MVVAGQRFTTSALQCVDHRIPAHPVPLRSGGGRQGARQPRKSQLSNSMDAGLSRALLFVRRPATPLRTKAKLVN